jgi:hypothetical protein
MAREMVGENPEWVWELLPALRDPTFVGPRDAEDKFVTDDLSRRAGRASWLLKEVTGRTAPSVRAQTDRVSLADLADDWKAWLDGLDGGAACWPP